MSVPGRYFDGQTAQPQAVTVHFTKQGVRLDDASGVIMARWLLIDVRILEDPEDDRPAVYTLESNPAVRLQVSDRAFHRNLIRYAPLSAPGRATLSLSLPALAGWCAAAAVVVALVAWGYPKLSRPVAHAIPDGWRNSIGEQVVTEMGRGKTECAAPEGLAALTSLSERLLAAAPDPTEQVHVRVYSGGPVNAFAAPGGELVMFEDLITKADGPDEVAGVLAHEIGHAIHRHPTQGVVNAVGMSVIVQFMLGGLKSDSVTTAATQLYTMGYSRDAEREADQTGAAMMRRAGISPNGMTTFFQRIQERYGDGDEGVMGYFSSHPSLSERIDTLSEQAEFTGRPALADAEWQALRAICADETVEESELQEP